MRVLNYSKLISFFLVLIALNNCGFKLKQEKPLDVSLRSIHLIYDKIDPAFINTLQKSLKQRGVNLTSSSNTQLTLLKYQQTRRAASINTNTARQTETRVSKALRFSLNLLPNEISLNDDSLNNKIKVLIEPSTISRSKEYTNDNTNISGKAEEERILQKAIDKEIVSLLIRRLEGVSNSDVIKVNIHADTSKLTTDSPTPIKATSTKTTSP